MYSIDTKLEKLKYLNTMESYLYLNTVLTKVFVIAFVFEKFIVFVFKYYAMYLDPSLYCVLYSSYTV